MKTGVSSRSKTSYSSMPTRNGRRSSSSVSSIESTRHWNFGIIRVVEKFFNIAGQCIPTEHYMLPALDRLPEIRRLVARRLDLCVEFRDKRYAVEVKTSKNFAGEKSYAQLAGYLDKLGLREGWMAIFDEDKTKPWDEKLFARDVGLNGKNLHLIGL